MRQIPEAERHARNFRLTRRVHDLLIEVRTKFFWCFLLRKSHAITQKIGNLLIHRHAKEAAGQLMVCRPHIRVAAPLHIIDDLLIAVNGWIQAVIVRLRIHRRFTRGAH